MKKKFLQIVFAVVTLTILLTVSVFAADVALFDSGTKNSAALPTWEGMPEANITWESKNGLVDIDVKKKTVTAKAFGANDGSEKEDKITAEWWGTVGEGDSATEEKMTKTFTVVITKRVQQPQSEEVLTYTFSGGKTTYLEGAYFDTSKLKVYVKYNDDTADQVSDYKILVGSPTGSERELTQGDTAVYIKYGTYTPVGPINITVQKNAVEKIEIVTPEHGKEYTVGDTVDRKDVDIRVHFKDKTSYIVEADKDSGVSLSPDGALEESHKTLTVTYEGKSAEVYIKVNPVPEETPTTPSTPTQDVYTVVVKTKPTKMTYFVGDSLNLSGIKFDIYKNGTLLGADKTSANLASVKYTFTAADIGTTSLQITFTYSQAPISFTLDGFTVTRGINTTGLKKTSSYYKLLDKDDINIKAGDKLNDDIYWNDIFDEVHLIVDGENKKIDSKSDLEDYPGVELLLKVYNKSSDSDVIEASDIRSDGTVRLQLYVKNGDNKITSTDYSILEYIPVADAGCTVYIYSTKNYTSSTSPKATAVFDDIYEALEALENDEKDAFEDAFGSSTSFGTNYAILIKLGEDQAISKSDVFEPDHHVPVTIDLYGHELSIYAEKWISYEEDDDFELTVTNSSYNNDGTLVYKDKSLSLVVATGSQLVFSKGKIPTDTDAACTVTIQRSSSSSTVIATKVYDDLADAFEAFEEKDEVIENFDVPSSYEDTFVLKIKLGDDQNLGSYKFAPDYDTTISIDLNGYELKLKSDWIDYDDCEDLVVSVNNTNADEKGTLTYSDKTTSALIAKGDSAFKFEEGKIPGLYKVEIGTVTNGKVTANPNKTALGKGNNVTFTITPNAGYEISTVKNGTKTISASTSGYTVDSKGVATYKVENISADIKLEVTFKKTSASSSSSGTSSSAANWNNPFTDVTTNAQYYDAVAYVCSEGLFNGMTATKFEPYTTMTRAMFVTVLGRLAGINEMLYSGTSFTDVSKSDAQIAWAAPYIEWAVQKGITNGTGNGKFSPNEPITHQQMYLFMQRYAEKIAKVDTSTTGVNLSGIRDAAQIADWAEDGVKFASKYGILITSDSKLTPTDNAYRCELAMLLHGFCVKVLEQ